MSSQIAGHVKISIWEKILSRAIAKLLGIEPGKMRQPPNVMGDIEYFTVHDLRRMSRSLLASLSVPPHVAERCLNHKLKGV